MAKINITTVRDMIDASFYEADTNTVNFKMIQNVLYILARQLRILQRHVSIERVRRVENLQNEIMVTEIKVHSKMSKKVRGGPESQKQGGYGGPEDKTGPGGKGGKVSQGGPGVQGGPGGQGGKGSQVGQGSTEGQVGPDEGKGAKKDSKSSSGKSFPTKSPKEKTSADDPTSTDDTTTSSAVKTAPKTSAYGPSLTDNILTSSVVKTAPKPSAYGPSSTDDTMASNVATGAPKTSVYDPSSTDDTTTSSAIKAAPNTSAYGPSSTDDTTSSSAARAAPRTSFYDPSSTDDTTTKSAVITALKTSVYGPSSTDDTTTKSAFRAALKTSVYVPSSTEDTTTSSVAKAAPKTSAYGPSSTDDTTTSSSVKATLTANGKSVEKGDDRKRGKKVGDHNMEVLHEKLLVVSRTSSTSFDGERSSVVTLDQYRSVVAQIRALQAQFGLKDCFDDEIFRDILHKQTSMSHPMAAVNMSSRLQAAEKRLAAIMPVVMDLASKTPGINIESAFDNIFLKPPITLTSQTVGSVGDKLIEPLLIPQDQITQLTEIGPKHESDEESSEMEATAPTYENISLVDSNVKGVTYDELNKGLEEIYDEVLKTVTAVSKSKYTIADNAMKQSIRVEARLDQAMKVGDSYAKLDTSVEEYVDRINDIDGRITAQMTDYQDELTQMQHNLESGLDALVEMLAAPSGDPTAIAELNGHFTCFQLDIDHIGKKQREVKKNQMEYSKNIEDLKRKIKQLQVKKCTRDEVTDALSDKAGIAALNGMVSMEQYQAVRGDFEKRIRYAYEKFNNKEITWQKSIDDLIRELNEKADFNQLVYLNNEIQKYLAIMRENLDEMLDLVGDIDDVTTTKKLERYDNCLSCGTPFDTENKLSRPPVIGAESATEKKEANEKSRMCYPGYPITHPIDPRSLTCQNYCGASSALSQRESIFKMHVSALHPNQSTVIGTDGKVYLTDDYKEPCLPCNIQNGSRPGPIHVKKLISGPIETTLSDGEIAKYEKGITE